MLDFGQAFADSSADAPVVVVLRPAFSELNKEEGDLLWRLFENELTNQGLTVVDRSRLAEVLDELSLDNDGLTRGSLSRLGGILGSDYFIETSFAKMSGNTIGAVRAINVRTTQTAGASISVKSEADLLNSLETLASQTTALLAKIGSPALESDLPYSFEIGEITDELKQKRMAVFIPETHLPVAIPDPAAETEMIRLLIENGFSVSDMVFLGVNGREAVDTTENSVNIASGDADAMIRNAINTARGENIDFLIYGEAVSERAGRLRGFVRCQGRVELRVIDVKTGSILFAGSATHGSTDTSEVAAGKRALEKSAMELTERMLQALNKVVKE